ncbi:MAG: hypothetical protein ACTSYW_00420 [Candidatus Heimdallarchaeota archaeon]
MTAIKQLLCLFIGGSFNGKLVKVNTTKDKITNKNKEIYKKVEVYYKKEGDVFYVLEGLNPWKALLGVYKHHKWENKDAKKD